MATQIRLIDDIDATSDGVRTHRFSLDSSAWEIDLSGDNFAALRTALEPYITVGRRDSTKVAPTTTTRPVPGTDGKKIRDDIRAWWADNYAAAGLRPPTGTGQHGRIPDVVINAYHASRAPRP